MKITISSSGEDENDDFNVAFVMQAENTHFKGVIEFYEFDNCFKDFATEILKFPFESQRPITFDADGIKITILLEDEVEKTRVCVSIKDEENNSLKFSDTSTEIEDLHKLARLLLNSDFSKTSSVIWESAS